MSAAPVLSLKAAFSLKIIKGDLAGQVLSFTDDVVKIGRGPDNEVVFANDVKMSRQHAEIL